MKGTIRENLGGSRYIVGIQVNAEPVTGLLADLNQQYADISQKLIQAQGELLTAQEPYDALLVQIEVASLAYQACVDEFNLGQCVDTKIAICQADYSDCEDACYDIESGEGECDFECQKARDACKDRCQREREACLAQANVDCQEQYNQHVTECQKTWSPLISDLQQQALEMLPTIQEIMTRIAEAQAQQLSLARRINELDGVQSREEQVTCWRAQYDDGLAAGTAVEVARTPAGRTVITEIVAPDACLQDARGLPAKHVFVNSALYPGFETWRPTWRTGTVKAINEDGTLKIEIKSGTLAGSLGTLYSRNPIDCTPPQAYFDGNWETAEQRIKAAREALTAAQAALQDAAKVRDDCIAQYDQTWSNICYTDKAALCDSTWASWLATCVDLEGIDPAECQVQYEASLAACYAQALADCADEKDALIAQCRADHQPAVDAAQAAVDAAEQTMRLELAGTYQPASPLVLDLPVRHCDKESYQIGDDVLIDFTTRTGISPMAVWNSAGVIGWASNTRECVVDIYWPPNATIVLRFTIENAGTALIRNWCDSEDVPDELAIFHKNYSSTCLYGPIEDPCYGESTVAAFDVKLVSYFVFDSFTYKGFTVTTDPGINHRTANFSYGPGQLSQTDTYIMSENQLNIISTNVSKCADYLFSPDYPGTPYNNFLAYGSGTGSERRISYNNIHQFFTFPEYATLRHDATGQTKQYKIRKYPGEDRPTLAINYNPLPSPVTDYEDYFSTITCLYQRVDE